MDVWGWKGAGGTLGALVGSVPWEAQGRHREELVLRALAVVSALSLNFAICEMA